MYVLSCFGRVQLFATLWTLASRLLTLWKFSRQGYWSVFSCPSPGDLPNPGMNPRIPHCRRFLYCWATQEAHIYVYIHKFSNILFHYKFLQDTECSFLCRTVGSCWLSILYIIVCIFQSQTPDLSLCPLPFGNHKFAFCVCESTSVLQINSFVSPFLRFHM